MLRERRDQNLKLAQDPCGCPVSYGGAKFLKLVMSSSLTFFGQVIQNDRILDQSEEAKNQNQYESGGVT